MDTTETVMARRDELVRGTARLSVRRELLDLHAADAEVWRGPCGAWHYADESCRACVALERAALQLAAAAEREARHG